MLRNSLAALCIAGLLTGPGGAQSDTPDIAEETPAYTIEANIPDLPASDPKLTHRLGANVARTLVQYRKDAEIAKKEAEAEKFEFRQYNLTVNWHIELDHPRFVSLVNYTWVYSGGAHGNTTFESLLWDRDKQASLPLADLFANPGATEQARKVMRAYVTKDLLAQKAKNQEVSPESYEDEQVTSGVTEAFSVFTLEPSDQQGKIAGLRMWYPPYAVGAYAEGSFESFVPHKVFSGFLREDLKPLFGGKSGRRPQ